MTEIGRSGTLKGLRVKCNEDNLKKYNQLLN